MKSYRVVANHLFAKASNCLMSTFQLEMIDDLDL